MYIRIHPQTHMHRHINIHAHTHIHIQRASSILGTWAAPGSPGQPESDQATSSIVGVWAAPGGPRQPDSDQATSSMSGVWAAPGSPDQPEPDQKTSTIWAPGRARAAHASRTPTERHLGGPGRPKPAGPHPRDIHDLGAWAALGGPGQPDPDRATSSILAVWAAPGCILSYGVVLQHGRRAPSSFIISCFKSFLLLHPQSIIYEDDRARHAHTTWKVMSIMNH